MFLFVNICKMDIDPTLWGVTDLTVSFDLYVSFCFTFYCNKGPSESISFIFIAIEKIPGPDLSVLLLLIYF